MLRHTAGCTKPKDINILWPELWGRVHQIIACPSNKWKRKKNHVTHAHGILCCMFNLLYERKRRGGVCGVLNSYQWKQVVYFKQLYSAQHCIILQTWHGDYLGSNLRTQAWKRSNRFGASLLIPKLRSTHYSQCREPCYYHLPSLEETCLSICMLTKSKLSYSLNRQTRQKSNCFS